MGAHHHHLPHHTRFLQHQQSAPNLRLGTQTPEEALPYQISGITPPARPFDRSLVEEFEMCVRAVLMASHRVYCRHVYRQLTAEVSELYARVAKNQVPKKAVKKIIAARQPATPGERIELERQCKYSGARLTSASFLNFPPARFQILAPKFILRTSVAIALHRDFVEQFVHVVSECRMSA